jgi:L-alanine-DL-glutamate epimerase-like enolase superfamily enzyme
MATAVPTAAGPAVERLEACAYTIPTDEPESDGTLEWSSTTMVVVEAHAGGATGVGYTYGDRSLAEFIRSQLAEVVLGADVMAPPAAWSAMQQAIRNAGQSGAGAMALSAVDIALWDLKARVLELPLIDVLPRFRDSVPVYGSGGFTSYSLERLQEQVVGWSAAGIPRVKMKVGRRPDEDEARLRAARDAIGDATELMVDANGAYGRKQALAWAERFAGAGVTWLEEPVSSEDLEGLRLLRDRAPAGLEIAAGEYAWRLPDLGRFLEAGAVDVLQADVTRCGGITGMLGADALCRRHGVPFSAHCAPAVSAHACCAMETLRHLEYFHDHVRAEALLFDGTLQPDGGLLRPDRSRAGLGIELRRADAARFAE